MECLDFKQNKNCFCEKASCSRLDEKWNWNIRSFHEFWILEINTKFRESCKHMYFYFWVWEIFRRILKELNYILWNESYIFQIIIKVRNQFKLVQWKAISI